MPNPDTKIEEMDKDQLEAYALANHGVELDKRKKLDDLRAQVAEMDAPPQPKGNVKAARKEPEGYLRHPTNHRVYKATPLLKARGDMIPCDKNGKNV